MGIIGSMAAKKGRPPIFGPRVPVSRFSLMLPQDLAERVFHEAGLHGGISRMAEAAFRAYLGMSNLSDSQAALVLRTAELSQAVRTLREENRLLRRKNHLLKSHARDLEEDLEEALGELDRLEEEGRVIIDGL